MMYFLLVQGVSAATYISSCATISTSGEYRLTADIINSADATCINIQANNVVLDCQGYMVDGIKASLSRGIMVKRVSQENTNVTIKNCVVQDWVSGIYLVRANNNNILSNNASNNNRGIELSTSDNNFVLNNTVNLNNHYGINLASSDNNNFSANNISLNKVHGIDSFSSNNNTFSANTINSNSNYGLSLSFSNNNSILNNNISDNKHGLFLSSSNNNTFSTNTVSLNSLFGFSLASSNNNPILNNTIAYNSNTGISLGSSSNNNIIFDNAISNNLKGISLSSSNNNIIYNNYLNNTNNAIDLGSNSWNITKHTGPNIIGGLYRGGNYYSDYTGTDTNGDGFGEVSYNITGGNNVDYLPLARESANSISSCREINVSGEYNLTVNIINSTDTVCIDITANDVVLDCQGNMIDGFEKTYGTYGIRVSRPSQENTNVTIKNCYVRDWQNGIYLVNADNNLILNNTANSNTRGIYPAISDKNTLINNTANGNLMGIYLYPSDNNILSGNRVSSNHYGIHIHSSDNNIVSDNTATYNVRGMDLHHMSSNNIIFNNNASNNYQGIYLESASNNIFSNNTVNSNTNIGIYLYDNSIHGPSNNNVFSDNTVNSNTNEGIYIENSDNTTISNNTVLNNTYGIYLRHSDDNTLSSNTVNSNFFGIRVTSSDNNTIYNNYLNNTNNAYDAGTNFWNITNHTGTNIIGGPSIGGNYFADYTGTDANGDGFGEVPYNIFSGSNVDYLPLVMSSIIPVTSCMEINVSGEYELTSDIINSNATVCIDITADNVVFDCGGHAVNGDGLGNTRGIRVKRSSSTDTNVTVKNCVVSNWSFGIYLENSNRNILENNTAFDNVYALRLRASSNNVVVNNTALDNSAYGIYLVSLLGSENTVGNNVTGNQFYNNSIGIALSAACNNVIENNQVYSNRNHGIYLGDNAYNISSGNVIQGNIVFSNDDSGIYLINSDNNTIYNNYLNNTNNAYDNSNNFWNTTNHTGTNIIGGPNIGGNYFFDYAYFDTNGDGFGEVPYNISGGSNTDYLPLATEYATLLNYTIPLSSGWNQISTPIEPKNTSIEAVIGDLSGHVIVDTYNTPAGEWYIYDSDSPDDTTLDEIVAGKGYWLYSESGQDLIITGYKTAEAIDLYEGWNLVGYNSLTAMDIGTVLSSLNGTILVYAYNTSNNSWNIYNSEGLWFLNTFTEMFPGRGYWLRSDTDQTWVI